MPIADRYTATFEAGSRKQRRAGHDSDSDSVATEVLLENLGGGFPPQDPVDLRQPWQDSHDEESSAFSSTGGRDGIETQPSDQESIELTLSSLGFPEEDQTLDTRREDRSHDIREDEDFTIDRSQEGSNLDSLEEEEQEVELVEEAEEEEEEEEEEDIQADDSDEDYVSSHCDEESKTADSIRKRDQNTRSELKNQHPIELFLDFVAFPEKYLNFGSSKHTSKASLEGQHESEGAWERFMNYVAFPERHIRCGDLNWTSIQSSEAGESARTLYQEDTKSVLLDQIMDYVAFPEKHLNCGDPDEFARMRARARASASPLKPGVVTAAKAQNGELVLLPTDLCSEPALLEALTYARDNLGNAKFEEIMDYVAFPEKHIACPAVEPCGAPHVEPVVNALDKVMDAVAFPERVGGCTPSVKPKRGRWQFGRNKASKKKKDIIDVVFEDAEQHVCGNPALLANRALTQHGDSLDYVFVNMEAAVCKDGAETEALLAASAASNGVERVTQSAGGDTTLDPGCVAHTSSSVGAFNSTGNSAPRPGREHLSLAALASDSDDDQATTSNSVVSDRSTAAQRVAAGALSNALNQACAPTEDEHANFVRSGDSQSASCQGQVARHAMDDRGSTFKPTALADQLLFEGSKDFDVRRDRSLLSESTVSTVSRDFNFLEARNESMELVLSEAPSTGDRQVNPPKAKGPVKKQKNRLTRFLGGNKKQSRSSRMSKSSQAALAANGAMA